MENGLRNKGPWTHRAAIWLFAVAFGLLMYWLLGFIVNDVGDLPGPSYEEVEERLLDRRLVLQSQQLTEQIVDVKRQIDDQENRQKLLRDSTASSERTMNQMLELHRLSLEKNVEPSEAEQSALAEAQQLFLENQRRYQELNSAVSQLNEQLRDLQEQEREQNERLNEARRPVVREFERLQFWHEMKLAAIKLVILLPVLLVGVVLFVKLRHGLYAPLVYAFGIAVAAKVTLVMHEHFPTRYFKYVLILAALAVVTWILVFLLRAVAFPKRGWLLKQYREAYERFFCPICSYPIRRGPLKYVFWSRRSIKKLHFPPQAAAQTDEPYACPLCGTPLYEPCQACGAIRHALLPTCSNCGQTKPAEELFGQQQAG